MHVITSGHVTLSHLTCFRHIIFQLESDQNDMTNNNAGFCSNIRRGLGEDKNKQEIIFQAFQPSTGSKSRQSLWVMLQVVLSSIKRIIGLFMGKHTEFGVYWHAFDQICRVCQIFLPLISVLIAGKLICRVKLSVRRTGEHYISTVL